MNKEALFSDGTSEYTIPSEPKEFDTVTLRLRTAKGEKVKANVIAVMGDDSLELDCIKEESNEEDIFDYYDAELTLDDRLVTYYFKI